MKKVIFASALLLIFAGSAFAQFTFTGNMFAGVMIDSSFRKADQGSVNLSHWEEGAPKFEFAATGTKDTYGAKFHTKITPDAMSIHGVYAWTTFMDSALRFSAGRISDPLWLSSLGTRIDGVKKIGEVKFDDLTGLRVDYKVSQIQGLNVGAAFKIDDYEVEKTIRKIILGASYVQPMFNMVAAYDNGNNGRLLFCINMTPLDELSAGIQMTAYNLKTWDSIYTGKLILKEKVEYKVTRPLTVAALFGQEFSGVEDSDPVLDFALGASYRNIIPNLTPSLEVGMGSGDKFDTMEVFIQPGARFSLKGAAQLYMEYQMGLKMGSDLTGNEKRADSYHKFGVGIDIKAF